MANVQRACGLALLGCCIAAALGVQAAAFSQAMPPVLAELRVIEASAAGVTLELDSPLYTLGAEVHEGRTYSTLRIAGLEQAAQPGAPQVPLAATLLALPPRTEAVAEVVDPVTTSATTSARLPHPLAPAPQAVTSLDPAQVLPEPAAARYTPDPQIYADSALFPAKPVQVDAPSTWRGLRVVAVRVYPAQVDPAGGVLRFAAHLRFRIRFVPVAAQHTQASAERGNGNAGDGPLDMLAQQAVINYDAARSWRESSPAAVQVTGLDPARPWYKVAVDRDGLYSVSCAALAAAGAPLAAIDLATLQLFTGDQPPVEVALRVLDANGNRRCDAGDSLEFWGQVIPPGHPSAKYTGVNVYWLTYGAGQGKRMVERASADGGSSAGAADVRLHFEQNRYYRSTTPAVEDYDHWFWTLLSTAAPTLGATASYTFTLDHVAAGGTNQLTVTLAGYDGPHHTAFYVNDSRVGERSWSQRTLLQAELALPAGALHDGDNVLDVEETGTGSSLLVDSFDLVYHRALYATDDSLRFEQPAPGTWRYSVQGFTNDTLHVFDVTEPTSSALITLGAAGAAATGIVTPCPCTVTFADTGAGPRTYVVATDDRRLHPLSITAASLASLQPASGADYIAIAPAALLPALEPLLAIHREEGLRVQAVSVEDVYDRYAGGRSDPAAIRAFLADAYHTWTPPAPSYVLLVGDGTFDPRGYCTADGACPGVSTPGGANIIPPYLRMVDPWLGETAADNQLVALDAGSPLPALAIGRLPVTTLAETQALVAKIVAYERNTTAGSWQRQAVLVSDDAYNAAGTPEPAGNFWQAADGVADELQGAAAWLNVERMYLNPCDPAKNSACSLPNPPYAPYAESGALHASLAAALDEGRGLAGYVGHAAIGGWGGAPPIFQGGDAAALGNEGKPAVTFDLACYTGYFHYPSYPALAETLVRNPLGGAVAAWASSGLGVNAGHATLGRAFAEAVAQPSRYTLGMAAVHAKQVLYAAAAGAYADSLDTFHLFGDPAMRLASDNVPPTPTATPTNTPTAQPQPTLRPGQTPTVAPSTTPTAAATPIPTPLATIDPGWHVYLPHAARGGSGGAP